MASSFSLEATFGVTTDQASRSLAEFDSEVQRYVDRMSSGYDRSAQASAAAFQQILDAQAEVAAAAEKQAFDRMSDDEKRAALLKQIAELEAQIAVIDGDTVEKNNLKLAVLEKEQALYTINKQSAADQAAAAMLMLQSERDLESYRSQIAYSRLSTEEKLAVTRAEALALLSQISASETTSTEKNALLLQYEQKKTAIYSLNQELISEQAAATAKAAEAQETQNVATSKNISLLPNMTALMVATMAVGFTRSLLENANALQQQAQNLGMNSEAMQAFMYQVRQSNGTNEDANRILTTVKDNLDKLRAGVPEVTQNFKQLGLSAADFNGLQLDQSLEKTAAGFIKNRDQAGSFAAMQDIVGKTGRNLNDVLNLIGTDGFAKMTADAKEAGTVISDKTINALAACDNASQTLWESTKVLASEGFAPLAVMMDGAVSHINNTRGGWDKLKEAVLGFLSLANPTQSSFLLSAGAADIYTKSLNDNNKSLEDQKKRIIETATAQGLLKQYQDEVNRGAREGADIDAQRAIVQAQITKGYEDLTAAIRADDPVKRAQALLDIAKGTNAEKKLETDYTQQQTILYIQQLDTQKELLPLQDKINISIAAISKLENDIALAKLQGLDTTKLETEQKREETDLEKERASLAQQQNQYAADLVSLDDAKVAHAKAYFEIEQQNLTAAQRQVEVKNLLADGVENLNTRDRARLDILISQLTEQEKQSIVQTIIGNANTQLTAEQKAQLQVLTGQTEELTKHKQLVEAADNERLVGAALITKANDLIDQGTVSTAQQIYAAQLLSAQIEVQIANNSSVIAQLQSENDWDNARISALDGQNNLLRDQLTLVNAIRGAAADAAASISSSRYTEIFGIRINPGPSDQLISSSSNPALQGYLDKQQAQLQQIQDAYAKNMNAGSAAAGDLSYSVAVAQVQTEIDAIKREQSQRASITNTIRYAGEDAARRMYGDAAVNAAKNSYKDVGTQSLSSLSQIQLNTSGLASTPASVSGALSDPTLQSMQQILDSIRKSLSKITGG